MPWQETHVLEERLKFIAAYQSREWSLVDLCQSFGISRKTGYKYLARYRELGLDGLKDFPRAPKSHPNQTSSELEELILKARKRFPNWGAKKLLAWLSRKHPDRPWPACSTVGAILKRHGLVRTRRRVRRATPSTRPLQGATHANAVWCADFKGWFRTHDGKRVCR